jgi:3-hydroxyethyl bacteriochlorophyllide a dehydrogenase
MMSGFETLAVVLHQPQALTLDRLPVTPPGAADVVVEVAHSGISTGTERLLWSGRMPTFPGMGYPLVPGYESVGRVVEAGVDAGLHAGDTVFVPGSNCFGPVRGLFGGAARHLVLPGARAVAIDPALHENGVLLALAATALHALRVAAVPVDLIVGHGALGRLLARLAVLEGATPTVWETEPRRREGARGYTVVDPAQDERRDRRCVIDVSGDATLLDTLIARLAPQGRVVLAGFYEQPLSFRFAPAFMREAAVLVAAQWQPQDLRDVSRWAGEGRLDLDGLITHRCPASEAPAAYATAFADPDCLKMVLDWSACP